MGSLPQARDLLELGIDIVSEDLKHFVYHEVSAMVEYAGLVDVTLPTIWSAMVPSNVLS
jgi:hypothetical protein